MGRGQRGPFFLDPQTLCDIASTLLSACHAELRVALPVRVADLHQVMGHGPMMQHDCCRQEICGLQPDTHVIDGAFAANHVLMAAHSCPVLTGVRTRQHNLMVGSSICCHRLYSPH